MKKELLTQWQKSTIDLAEYFVHHYFGRDAEAYWIADDIGGCMFVNDYFFNLSTMVDFIKYSYNKNKMFEYYQYTLDCNDKKKIPINIKSYRHLKV